MIASENGEPPLSKLTAHSLGKFVGGWLTMVQYIIEAELLPLTPPELMEAQYFHALEASQSGAEVCNAFYVVVPIGEIGNQDKPDPHRPAEVRETTRVVECGLQRGTSDTLIDGGIARLDVEQVKIDVH